jgi:signal transduction histidine kinase
LSALDGAATLGWLLVLALAALAVGERIHRARRRAALNRALHELRRPLQALALAPGGPRARHSDAVRAAVAAVGDLDRAINGRSPAPLAPRPVLLRALVHAAVERWRGAAAAANRSLALDWRAGAAVVLADPGRVAQALDNLISNAIGHGGLRVRVEASAVASGVRISVRDSGGPGSRRSLRRDPRHGHGLRVVSSVASEHGGRFLIRTSPEGTVATLELPLAPAPPPEPGRRAGRGAGDPRRGPRPRPPLPVPGPTADGADPADRG